MNDCSNGRTLPAGWAEHVNTSGSPARVVPYRGLFLEPDIEPADDGGDDED